MTEPADSMHDIPLSGTADRLANEAEGYLLWKAVVSEAEQRAADFVKPIEWLTTSQRADVEERYVAERLQHARRDLERFAARCETLRSQYEDRYRQLRSRCVALTTGAIVGFLCTATLLLSLVGDYSG